MATTAEDLIVNIKAKLDQAKRDTAAYQKQLDQLDEGVQVPITVKGGRDLDDLFDKVSRLSREDASIVIGIEMARAQRDIKDLLYDISRLDSEDATIEVKVDQLAQARGDLEAMEAKVKALNDTPIEPGRGSNPRAGLDKIVDGADQANSAVANMVGNASQDIGQLTGITGSAGVALGQLAEYFTDTSFAAKAAGQSMGTAFKSFAMASLPIAGISIVVGLLTSIASKAGEMGRKINEASKVAVSSLLDVAEAGGKLGEGLDDVAESAVTKIFEELGSKTPKVVEALRRMGITWDEVTEGFRTGQGDLADMLTLWDRFEVGVSLYGNRQARLDFAERMGLSKDDANAMLDDLSAINDAFGESFDVQAKANEAASAAGKYRAEAADATEAAAEAEGKLAEETAKGTEEAQAQAEQARQIADALNEWATQALQAEGALAELAGTFSQIGMRSDALSNLFNLGNAPLDAQARLRDVQEGIAGLREAAKGIDLSAALDPTNMGMDKLVDAFDQLRPQIQGAITEAFAAGGPEAAQAMADGYVQQIVDSLGGKLSAEEVAGILGLTDLQATIAVALEQSSIESAKRQLAILVGLQGDSPYTASIALALEAGTITGEQAQALVQARLAGAGVDIPSTLAVPTTDAALAEANAALASTPATMPVTADTAPAQDAVDGLVGAVEGAAPTVTVGADTDPAEREAQGFRRTTESTKPVVTVDANTREAISTMLYLKILSALLQPEVRVTADTTPAEASMVYLTRSRDARVNVDLRGVSDADRALDDLTRARSVTIRPNVVPTSVLVRVDGGG